jgi:hypothetical protein
MLRMPSCSVARAAKTPAGVGGQLVAGDQFVDVEHVEDRALADLGAQLVDLARVAFALTQV